MKITNPKLRFKDDNGNDFPDWDTKKLGAVYSFNSTNSFSRECLNYNNGLVKNIHYGDIHTKFNTLFNIEKENVPFVNIDIQLDKIKSENYCQIGDLIIADASEDYADIGKTIEIININNQKILAGLHTLHARPKPKIMAVGFSGYMMKSFNILLQIKTIAQGTKVLSISANRLANISISIPNLAEQTKIANFLSAINEKINLLRQKHSLLTQYKKGLMQKLFSQELRFKDDNGNDFPDWETKKLGEIATRITTKNKENNTNVLTISAQQGLISQLEFFNKPVSAKDVKGYFLLNKNDFAYNKSYSKGYPMGAIKKLNRYEKGVVSTLYICFKFENVANHQFMEQYFETGIQNKEIELVAQEGARNHGLLNIGINDFFSILINFPNLAEQTKIANFLSAIDEKINITAELIKQNELYKKGLMQKMFV